jgi:hypothetical protein
MITVYCYLTKIDDFPLTNPGSEICLVLEPGGALVPIPTDVVSSNPDQGEV